MLYWVLLGFPEGSLTTAIGQCDDRSVGFHTDHSTETAVAHLNGFQTISCSLLAIIRVCSVPLGFNISFTGFNRV